MTPDMEVFSNDFSHFEQNHAAFPIEAQSVFTCVSDLRQALIAFRAMTENQCVVDNDAVVADVIGVMDDAQVADVIDAATESKAIEEAVVADALTVGPTEEPVSVADAIAAGPSTVEDRSVEEQLIGPEQMDEARLSPVHVDYLVEESVQRED